LINKIADFLTNLDGTYKVEHLITLDTLVYKVRLGSYILQKATNICLL